MEQLKRFELLVGSKNIEKISNTKVLVLGLGGVGSYALEAIVRSGVGSVVIVDYDKIDITNLNRQLMTNHNNIGRLKTEVWKERIKDINPNCNVEIVTKKLTKEDVYELFKYQINYVIDACDTLEVKKELILACHKNKVKLISSMGTGNKFDPLRLKIMDIRKTSYDPLAKKIRKFVVDNKINYKVNVVCSDELPLKVSKPIGSTAFVPATSGLLCASFVINNILKEK
jgi:tRNA A37 threonylcarbamoyladenosine dehydratase